MHRPSTHPARPVRRVRVEGAVVAVVPVVVAAVLGAGACTASGSAASPAVPTPSAASRTGTSTPDRPEPSRAGVADLLERRAAALLAGDDAGYARTLADSPTTGVATQLSAYSAARSLRVARLVHGPITLTPASGGEPARAEAEVTYRLDGLDAADRTARVAYELVPTGAGWAVSAEERAGTSPAPPWVAMPGMRVARTGHAVVAGTAPAPRLEEYARVVDRALPVLRRTWAGTPQRALVLAPGTAAEADALLGRPAGRGGSGVAATTEGPTGADGTASGDRVVLDPDAFARLTEAGRDVVLTHELAHVAVRSTVAGRPAPWLSEGYADHVGYTRSDVPAERLLDPLLTRVRAGRTPTALPTAGEMDPSATDIEVPYLAAWQAVELLVERHGEDAVRRLVVAASTRGSDADAEAATDRALHEVLGTSRAEVSRLWQQRIRALSE